MRYLAVLLAAAAATANGWKVYYYEGEDCTSARLGIDTYATGDECYNVDLANVSSAYVEPDGSTGEISFFVGSSCDDILLGSLAQAGCLSFGENGFGSVETSTSD